MWNIKTYVIIVFSGLGISMEQELIIMEKYGWAK